jgi:DNA-binding transcriptional LysR family regulator
MNMSKAYRFDKYKYMNVMQKEVVYFLATAEALNISKAAETLGIQQSGLSRAIHRLEQDLGQKLFQRKSIGLALTAFGERFYKAVKNTKQSWEESFKLLLNVSDVPAGVVKIGLHSSFGQTYLPVIIQDICSQYPQLEIEVIPLSSFQTTRKILEDEIDFGLVISDIKNPEIIQKDIGVDFLATYQSVSGKIPTHFFINPDSQMLGHLLKKHSVLKKVFIKDYELLAQGVVNATFALALLPHSVAQKYSALKQVSGKLVSAKVSLICHKDTLLSKANKKIYDIILSACKK